MASDQEILSDIQHIYTRIDQCYRSKTDINLQIEREHADIIGLRSFIEIDLERVAMNKNPRYNAEAMVENIQRCKNNIILFTEKLAEEDRNIIKFQEIVKVLQDDMARPKEIIIDMSKQ